MYLGYRYGTFVSGLCWSGLPSDVREKTIDLVADWIANAAAGFDSQIGNALFSLAETCGEKGKSLLLGNRQTTSPLQAAMINGGACHALEFDDAYRSGLYHPGAPVISAAWAAAGTTPVSGKAFLSSVVAGYEVSMRLADAVNPMHNQTWHTTGTIGTFGAAAGASACLGLDPAYTANALGLAGTQASGLWEILPDSPVSKGLHSGKAAQSGLMAALLSARGISGPPAIFEGPRGVFNAMVPGEVNMAACTAGLGDEWRLTRTTIKAYPACGHTMTAIEAALKLTDTIDPASIKAVEIRAHPLSVGIAGNMSPRTELEAKFSIAFCVAVTLVKKRVTLSEFAPEILSDDDVNALLAKTTLIADSRLTRREDQRPARVTLTLDNGSVLSEQSHIRKGDPEYPLNRAEMKDKFIGLVKGAWGVETAASVFDAVKRLPEYDDVNTWVQQHLIPRQASRRDTPPVGGRQPEEHRSFKH